MTRLAGSSKGSHKPHRNAIAARLCGLMPGSATVAPWLLYAAERTAQRSQSREALANLIGELHRIYAKYMLNLREIVCEHVLCRYVTSTVLAAR